MPVRLTCPRKVSIGKDEDFAVIWARTYGKGRVLYNGLGHTRDAWDRPDIQKMWHEMVQWSMGIIPGDATPRPANSVTAVSPGIGDFAELIQLARPAECLLRWVVRAGLVSPIAWPWKSALKGLWSRTRT